MVDRGPKTLQNQFAMALPVEPEDRHKRDLAARASESIDDSDARAGKVYSRRGEKDSVILANDFATRL